MSHSTLQKDLDRLTLKKDFVQALERMVDFEEEVNRDKEEFKEKLKTLIFTQTAKAYFVGFSFTTALMYIINGRSKDNKRRED